MLITRNKEPVIFLIVLFLFVAFLYIFNFDAIEEKLGIETRTSAIKKLENANNTIEQLKIANERLLNELKTKEKIQSVTDSVIKNLDINKSLIDDIMQKIENERQTALNQLNYDLIYIGNSSLGNSDLGNSDIEISTVADSKLGNSNVVNSANIDKPDKNDTIINKPIKQTKTKTTKVPDLDKLKTDKRSKIQITALWNTYNSLHAS